MPYFDRFDICEAYHALECDYHKGGVLWERRTCARRRESVCWQLRRIGFHLSPLSGGYAHLSENGKAIYDNFVARHFGEVAG